MYKKILVPLDGSENDQALLQHVLALAKQTGSALILIQLYRVIKDSDAFMQSIQLEIGSAGYKAKQKAEVYLPEMEQSLRSEGVDVSSEFLVVTGPEAAEIVRYASEKNCDLIALTNQATSGIGRWFFSSIEEKVRRRSTLPILLVSAKKDKE